MHGSAFRTTCLQCKHVNFTYDTPLSPALENVSADNFEEKVMSIDELPRCGGQNWNGSNRFGRCGGLLRPGVVWFGEVPEGMGEIAKVLNWTDVLIVVGTSSVVREVCNVECGVIGIDELLLGLPRSGICQDCEGTRR
jgi:NAD-dependent deacetylase sirtuin 5